MVLSECKTEQLNSLLDHEQLVEQTRGLFYMCDSGCGSLSITTPVILLANEFDVLSVLHGQVTLAAVNQICVIHEAVNGCKILKIY